MLIITLNLTSTANGSHSYYPLFIKRDCNNRKVRKTVQGHVGMTEPIFSHAIRIQSQVSLSLPSELLIPCELIRENIAKEREIDFGRMSESWWYGFRSNLWFSWPGELEASTMVYMSPELSYKWSSYPIPSEALR